MRGASMPDLGRKGFGLLSILGVLLLWELVCRAGLINLSLLPPPSQIAPALWKILASGSFLVPLGQTLGMLLIGYTIACVAGVVLGLLMGCSDYLYGLLEPLVEVIRPIPKPALIPAMVVFLGIGAGMKITMVALAALFPVLINTLQGVRGVDPVLLATARTLGCSRLETIRKIILPASLPMILTGMRVSLSMGLVLVILAEMLAAESGIGFLILDLQRSFQVRPMYAWITILAAVGLVLNVLFEMVEDCAVPWRAKITGQINDGHLERDLCMLSLKSLSGLVLTAAFAAFASVASAQTVRVNYIPITDVTPMFVAIDKGYFAAEGLTIVPTPSTGGAAGVPGLMAGAFDVMYGNVVSTMLAQQQGFKLEVIAAGTKQFENPVNTNGLVARQGDSIKTGKDL